MAASKKSSRAPAKKKSSVKKKPPAKKKTASKKSSGPLINVARKIGTTLGHVAVRTGITKLGGGSEPSGEQ